MIVFHCFLGIDDLNVNSVVNTLDTGMVLMFQFIDSTCKHPNGELKCVEAKTLFTDFLEVRTF